MIQCIKLALIAAILFSTPSKSLQPRKVPTLISCELIEAPHVPGAHIISTTGIERRNVSAAAIPLFLNHSILGLDICDVSVILTHPGVEDRVSVTVWLPLRSWNGRFQATGGAGYSSEAGDYALAAAAEMGYAAAMTDGGHTGDEFDPPHWALGRNGEINWGLLTNFASRSLHDMAVIGKAVTSKFYGSNPHHSYWNGCSTGGRQGIMAAQKYPKDFDGILAASPAINWPSAVVAEQWPQVVMQQENNFPTQCEFNAFLNVSITECDRIDGVIDGIISNPGHCLFDPYKLVGSHLHCDGRNISISQATAGVVAKILNGPTTTSGYRLWYGLNPGTVFNGIANTTTLNQTTIGVPFPLSNTWIEYFLRRNPKYSTSTITYSEFEQLFLQSNEEYNFVIGTDNPDLSGFRDAGGKMITWHGLADEFMFPNGTINYYQRVEEVMGEELSVDSFYRLFLAPGVGHCGAGYGPVPVDPLAALVYWVERGQAPDSLAAEFVDSEGDHVTRDICRYPFVSRYNGTGDPKSTGSFTCANSFLPILK